MTRGALIRILIFAVLCCVFSATALEIAGCNETIVNISEVSDFTGRAADLSCNVVQTHRPTHVFGRFLPNQDIEVAVDGQSIVTLRLDNGALVDVDPRFARPSVRLVCPGSLVQGYLDEGRWPDRFHDVRRIMGACSIRSLRFVIVPQVTGLSVTVVQAQGALDLLGEYDWSREGFLAFIGDVARLTFAGPYALGVFVAQFAGVGR